MQPETINSPQQLSVPPLVLDRQEAATALRISTRKLDYLIQRGEIKATRIDTRVLVAWAELLRFVENKSAKGQQLQRA
jgi:excisionase family DNA binding protein